MSDEIGGYKIGDRRYYMGNQSLVQSFFDDGSTQAQTLKSKPKVTFKTGKFKNSLNSSNFKQKP